MAQKIKRGKYTPSLQENCLQKLDSALLIFEGEPEKALNLVEEALLISIKNNFRELEGKAYGLLGDFNFNLGEYMLSLKNYEKAIDLLNPQKKSNKRSKITLVESESLEPKDINDQKLFYIYKQAGQAAQLSGNLNKSFDYYFNFLNFAEEQDSEEDILFAKVSIADVYLLQGNFEEAEEYYSEVLNMEVSRNNKKGIIETNIKLGKLFLAKNDNEIAMEYFQSSRDMALEIGDDEAVNRSFEYISDILAKEDNIVKQLEVSQQAMQYNEERGNVREMARNAIDVGNIYSVSDSNEKAIEHLQKGVELSEESGDIETKSEAVKALSEAYEKEGSETDALETYKEYVELEDSINKLYKDGVEASSKKGRLLENTHNKVIGLEKDKEIDEKTIELLRREKDLQEEQLRRQKLLSWFLSGGLLLVLIASFFVYKSNRERKRANSMLMLKSLRSQMNPHFIFNALNSVNSFISTNDERAANKYLADFSRLMRDVLENSSQDFIPLSKEIEILNLYLKLEHSRFREKFDYKFDVDANIDKEDFLIPPMLVQPYIENAVWHGLRYASEKGYLHVLMKQKDDAVKITIIDNGIGRKRSQEIKTKNQKILKSTGLENISNRLNIIRDVYKVKLDVSIKDLNPGTGEGTVVTLLLHRSSLL